MARHRLALPLSFPLACFVICGAVSAQDSGPAMQLFPREPSIAPRQLIPPPPRPSILEAMQTRPSGAPFTARPTPPSPAAAPATSNSTAPSPAAPHAPFAPAAQQQTPSRGTPSSAAFNGAAPAVAPDLRVAGQPPATALPVAPQPPSPPAPRYEPAPPAPTGERQFTTEQLDELAKQIHESTELKEEQKKD